MRRTVILTAVLAALVATGTAVVGHNNSGGQMGITSSSSAGATTAVGPNGTEYTAKVSMAGRNQNETGNSIRNESISSSKAEFSGTITAATPCHVLEHEVNRTGDSYVLDVKTVKEGQSEQLCAQVVTGIDYNAELEADPGFNLEVRHNGEKIESFETVHQDKEDSKSQDEGRSLLDRLLGFLGL